MAREIAAPFPPPEIDWSSGARDWQKQEATYIESLNRKALARLDGDVMRSKPHPDLIGEVVRWQRADGYAQYMIWDTSPLTLVHLNLGDGYTVEASLIRGLTVDDVKQMVEWERNWKRASTEPNEVFYGSVNEGDIVHYSNGFGEFVRCKVVNDSAGIQGVKLLPIALVGGLRKEGSRSGWFEWDLYRRLPDGSVQYGYYVKRIVEGETMQPHASSIYEYSGFSDRLGIDPRTMEPLPLEPPPMDEAKQRIVPLAQAVNRIRARLESPPWDDEAGMKEALADVAAVALNELDSKE